MDVVGLNLSTGHVFVSKPVKGGLNGRPRDADLFNPSSSQAQFLSAGSVQEATPPALVEREAVLISEVLCLVLDRMDSCDCDPARLRDCEHGPQSPLSEVTLGVFDTGRLRRAVLALLVGVSLESGAAAQAALGCCIVPTDRFRSPRCTAGKGCEAVALEAALLSTLVPRNGWEALPQALSALRLPACDVCSGSNKSYPCSCHADVAPPLRNDTVLILFPDILLWCWGLLGCSSQQAMHNTSPLAAVL
mmetsp:Transcript_56543/g.132627  ORF Transcript_56543/g.132627 Transcript_56543/m.132627 type:complete len:248 (-) Transcript_56543:169-912(-)